MPINSIPYNPEETTDPNIPNMNESSYFTVGRRSGGGMLSNGFAQVSGPTTRTTTAQGSLGGGGMGPVRPVEPSPGPGVTPPTTEPVSTAPAPSGPTPSSSVPWSSGPGPSQTDPPEQDPLAAPGSVVSAHTNIPRADPQDPNNWAYGLKDTGKGSFYDPSTGMYYDRYGKKIKMTHTGPVSSDPYDPGDGQVWPTPGSGPGGSNPGWGVNPMEWFPNNTMQLHESNVSVEGMLLGPHQAQQSENVTVGPMSQAQAFTAPGTNVEGLINPQASEIDSGPEAQAHGYQAHTQEVDPTQTASGQMAEITGRDSPLMQRARQEGLLMAGRRGLINSSLAAGAALGAMVDRAQPLALANAQQYAQQDLANQAALNAASQFNATWENNMEQLNKSIRSQEATAETQLGLEGEIAARQIQSAESQFNAELQTRNAQFNAQWANQATMLQAELRQQNNQFNAAQQNQIDAHIMQLNTALNEQYLRGSQALDLATIQGQFSSLIAQNQTAGNLFGSYMQSIGQMMANPELSPETVASYVEIQQNILTQALQLIADMNSIQFGDSFDFGGLPEGAPGGGGGGGSENPPSFNRP